MKTKRPVPLLIQHYTNKPLLATPEYVDEIFTYLESRGEREEVVLEKEGGKDKDKSRYSLPVTYNEDTKVGVINLFGHSTYRPSGWEALSGGYSYRALYSDVEALVEAGAETIVYNIDSFGGEAHGMVDTSKKLREFTRSNKVKTVAFVDGAACSAGYGIASSADEIIATPDSDIGSIGVVVRLNNKSAKESAPHTTYVYAGDSKVAYDEDGEFTPQFLREVKDSVEEVYGSFTKLIASNRGIEVENVIGTQASTYRANKAKEIGLVDKILNAYDFQVYLADIADSSWDTRSILTENNNKEKEMLEELKASLEEAVTYNETLEEQVADLEATLLETKEAKLELTAELEKLQAELEALTQENKDIKLSSRKEKLSAVVGESKAEEMLEAMSTLDEEAFNVVLSGLGTTLEATKSSGMFQTLGSSVTTQEVSEEAEEVEDATMKALSNILGE